MHSNDMGSNANQLFQIHNDVLKCLKIKMLENQDSFIE